MNTRRKIFEYLLFSLLFLMSAPGVYAQTPYTSSVDNKQVTILKGLISKYALVNNTAFSGWYAANRDAYAPSAAVLQAMAAAAHNNITFMIFGGTWCEDTQFILPKFFKLQDLAGFPDSSTTFFAVDRSKKTLGNAADVFHITNVPTIIVLKNGKETGRLIEYGSSGKWDDELAGLLTH